MVFPQNLAIPGANMKLGRVSIVGVLSQAIFAYFPRSVNKTICLIPLVLASQGLVVVSYASEESSGQAQLVQRIEVLEAELEQLTLNQSVQRSMLEDAINRVDITGYVSLRGGQLNETDFTYLGTIGDEWSFSTETTFGIQLKAPIADKASVLLQFSGDSLESQAEVDWAFLEYRLSTEMTLRGGRLRVPGFMMSEYREVGYAYPWVQTPLEVYGLTPFLRYEGLDLRYYVTFGELDLRFNPFLGSTRNQDLMVGRVKYAEQNSQFGGIDIQANFQAITARLSYSIYDFDIIDAVWDNTMSTLIEGQVVVPGSPPVEVPGILDIIDSLTGIADGLAPTTPAYGIESLSLNAQKANYPNNSTMGGDRKAEYFSLGISYDSEQLLLLAEVIKGGIDGAFPDANGGYLTFGYRFGNWMPHITYAKIKSTDDDERFLLPDLTVTEALWAAPALAEAAAAIAGANTQVRLVNETRNLSSPDQRSWTIGMRWDPISGIALKAEYQYIKLLGDSYGYILPKEIIDGPSSPVGTSGFREKVDDVNVVKFSLDLVF